MKKLWVSVSLAVAASALALALASSSASAEGAEVLDVSKCTILDGHGELYPTTDKNKAVFNKNGDVLRCSAKKIPTPGHVARFNKANTGYRCCTGRHLTDDWHEVVSASGNATLICKFKFD
jgi:hypothetical protein